MNATRSRGHFIDFSLNQLYHLIHPPSEVISIRVPAGKIGLLNFHTLNLKNTAPISNNDIGQKKGAIRSLLIYLIF